MCIYTGTSFFPSKICAFNIKFIPQCALFFFFYQPRGSETDSELGRTKPTIRNIGEKVELSLIFVMLML